MFYLRDLHGKRVFDESAIIQLQLIGVLGKVPLQRIFEGLIIRL
jgi:hypothetical protein